VPWGLVDVTVVNFGITESKIRNRATGRELSFENDGGKPDDQKKNSEI